MFKLSFIHCTEAAFRYRIKVRSDMINNLYELTDHGTSVIQPNKVTGGKNDKCFSRFLKQIKKWDPKKLLEAKEILFNTEVLIKTNVSSNNNTLIKNLIINLYNKAISTS